MGPGISFLQTEATPELTGAAVTAEQAHEQTPVKREECL